MMPRHGNGALLPRRVDRYLSHALNIYIRISVLQEWEAPRALLNPEAQDERNDINFTKNQR